MQTATRRSACSYAQSNQRLCSSCLESLKPIVSISKTLRPKTYSFDIQNVAARTEDFVSTLFSFRWRQRCYLTFDVASWRHFVDEIQRRKYAFLITFRRFRSDFRRESGKMQK